MKELDSPNNIIQNSVAELKQFDWDDLGDLDSVGVWPGPVKVLVGTIIFLACLGAGYWFHIKSLREDFATVAAREGVLRSDLESKAGLVSNLEAYRQQMVDMEESFGALLRVLPGKSEVPELIEDIDSTGSGSGLNIVSVDPSNEVIQELYIELPIDIIVNGSYHDFGTFVSGMASLSRIVTLHNFDISVGANRSSLNMNIAAKTYRYKDLNE